MKGIFYGPTCWRMQIDSCEGLNGYGPRIEIVARECHFEANFRI